MKNTTQRFPSRGTVNHTDHNWNHIVCSIFGTNLMQWNDGALVTQVQLLTCPFSSYPTAGPVRIGWPETSGFRDVGYAGTLDDIRI